MTSEEAIARARDWLDRRPRTGAHEIVESLLAALSTPAAPAQDDALVADGKKLLAMILGPCKQRLEHEWHKCKRCILMEELGYPGDSLAKRALASLLSAPPAAPAPADLVATCEWSEDANGEWHTGCGTLFFFDTDGPTEHKFGWCYHCGKPLAPVPFLLPEVPDGK